MKENLLHIASFFTLLIVISCSKEQAIPVEADFEIRVVNNDFSIPVQVIIINKTTGAETYDWFFEGGTPSSSSDRNPGAISFNQKGEYILKLFAANQDGSEGSKDITINLDDPVLIDFDFEIAESNFPPVKVSLFNKTTGANTFKWTFEEGTPLSSDEENPGEVMFLNPGEHTIKLIVENGRETHELEKTIFVEENIDADFSWDVAFEDDDYQAPVRISMSSTSTSVTSFSWTFENGTPSTSTEENPDVVFSSPGIHNITLEVSNGKESKTISKTIEVFENTNIREFKDIRFGINATHNSNDIGAFFSTSTRESYTKNQITEEVGPDIDLVFFGLNSSFTINRFLSPDNLSGSSFDPIPEASKTKLINSLESCDCGITMTVSDFDSMDDDTLLRSISIEETNDGLLPFDNSIVPRIVLFENSAGLKGAIKIKDFVIDGQQSYILTDIKVQKEIN